MAKEKQKKSGLVEKLTNSEKKIFFSSDEAFEKFFDFFGKSIVSLSAF